MGYVVVHFDVARSNSFEIVTNNHSVTAGAEADKQRRLALNGCTVLSAGEYLDILAVSCDSFDSATNAAIGRQHRQTSDHLESLKRVRDWCAAYRVAFKLNTVVNDLNVDEDMVDQITQLRPVRWKVRDRRPSTTVRYELRETAKLSYRATVPLV